MIDMNFLVICVLVALLITNFSFCITIGFMVVKQLKENNRLKQIEMDMKLTVSDNDFLILDKLIQETFDFYLSFNEELLEADYIKDSMLDKMVKDLLYKVMQRISPIYLNKLSYIYNREYIEDLILEKIRHIVMDYCININGTYSEK